MRRKRPRNPLASFNPLHSFVIPDLVGTFIYNDIGYPFKVEYLDVGHAIDDVDMKGVSPITLVALTAMKYIFDVEKFSVSFREAAIHLLKMQNTDEGKDFIKQSLSYFFWKWPYKSEVIKMDSPEAIANK